MGPIAVDVRNRGIARTGAVNGADSGARLRPASCHTGAMMLELLLGRPQSIPDSLAERYPELRQARFRRGGLLPRVAGWCLGQSSVAAITLWNTVFLSGDVRLDPELLLHELRHVHQFGASPSFPARYVWESLRRGYHANRFEADARAWAAARLARERSDSREGDA